MFLFRVWKNRKMVQFVQKCAIDREHGQVHRWQVVSASIAGRHRSCPHHTGPGEPRCIDQPCPEHACSTQVPAARFVFRVSTTRTRRALLSQARHLASHRGWVPCALQDACRSTHSGGRHDTDGCKADGKPGASGTVDTQEWRYTPRTTWRGMREMRCWQ